MSSRKSSTELEAENAKLKRQLEEAMASEATTQLRMAEAQAQSDRILASIDNGFYAIDGQWRIVYFNHRAEEMLNKKRRDVIGRPFFDVFPMVRDSEVHLHYQTVMREHRTEVFDAFSPIMKRWVSFRVFPSPDGGFSVYFEDVTEAREAAAALEAAKAEAEAANLAKSTFLANMSHELRTPLNAVIGFAELIELQVFGPIAEPKYIECAHDLKSAGKHLLDIISDILDISKIEARKWPIRPEAMAITDVVEECLTLVRGHAEAGGLAMTVLAPSDLPSLIADRRSFKQCLLNLLSNAIKFTRAGGVITVAVERRPPFLAVSVADTGIGIPTSAIPRLIQPFEQVEPAYSRHHPGTGLGLTLARSIVELHGGRMVLDSEEGKGTNVTLLFPMAGPAPQAE